MGWEFSATAPAPAGPNGNPIRLLRRMILVLEAALRQTLYHTVMRGGLILNLQVTQFMLHRAVMLRNTNTIMMDHLALCSILFTVGSTFLFDLVLHLRPALNMYRDVKRATRDYCGERT